MSRIIINNKADLSDQAALGLVSSIVADGMISGDGDCYCCCTTTPDYCVIASRSKTGSHVFTIGDKD